MPDLHDFANDEGPEERLRKMGIELPHATIPLTNHAAFVRMGNLIFLSGQGPRKRDGSYATGKVGKDVTAEEAYHHARLAGLSLLALMRDAAGSLDAVVRVGKVFGMVNATADFVEHPKVINGCSDLFMEVFGDRALHARSALGMASLPFNVTVEIEAVIEIA
jgi:enamine deaminase RidA (YjgF/YER057c/UK114 family)